MINVAKYNINYNVQNSIILYVLIVSSNCRQAKSQSVSPAPAFNFCPAMTLVTPWSGVYCIFLLSNQTIIEIYVVVYSNMKNEV